MTNTEIAKVLRLEAKALAGRASALYRVRAYRQAANWIAMYPRDLETVYAEEGRRGLERIPGVGAHLAYLLEGLVTTGEVRAVRGETDHLEPQRRTASLPGIGPLTAARLRDEASIETIDQLAEALDRAEGNLPGLGPRRVAALRQAIRERDDAPPVDEPAIEDLLAVDTLFREKCRQEEALEPLLARSLTWCRAGYRFLLEYDHSALAFRLEQVGDRVVVRFADGVHSGERLIETETQADMAGWRVVRGREEECRRCYARRLPVADRMVRR